MGQKNIKNCWKSFINDPISRKKRDITTIEKRKKYDHGHGIET